MKSSEQVHAGTPGTGRRHAHLPARLWRWLRDMRGPVGLHRPTLAELLVEVPLALALLSAVLLANIASPGGF